MEIRLLRYFLAVARAENITHAAEGLHISQPSLSKQLMELEQEVGKQLFIRGKRKITLTEDGVLLRRRADEIIALIEKTERELRADDSQIGGTVGIGGNPTKSVLRAAAEIRRTHPEIQFQFYSGDATDVLERLEHGSLDFAVLLQPVDSTKYEYLSLPDGARWGLLLPDRCPLAEKAAIERDDLRDIPLILHHRAGLQQEIAHWAQTEIDHLNIAATYNVISSDPSAFVQSGLGCLLTTDDHLPSRLNSGLCFRPLSPALEIRLALVWKQYTLFSRAADVFLREMRRIDPAQSPKSPDAP